MLTTAGACFSARSVKSGSSRTCAWSASGDHRASANSNLFAMAAILENDVGNDAAYSTPSRGGRRTGRSPPAVLARLEQRPELLGDRLPGAEDPGAHGADRAVHDRRDVLVAQPLDLAQRDRVAQL